MAEAAADAEERRASKDAPPKPGKEASPNAAAEATKKTPTLRRSRASVRRIRLAVPRSR